MNFLTAGSNSDQANYTKGRKLRIFNRKCKPNKIFLNFLPLIFKLCNVYFVKFLEILV